MGTGWRKKKHRLCAWGWPKWLLGWGGGMLSREGMQIQCICYVSVSSVDRTVVKGMLVNRTVVNETVVDRTFTLAPHLPLLGCILHWQGRHEACECLGHP